MFCSIATYTVTSGDLFELKKKIDQRSNNNSKGFKEGADGWALIFSAFFPLHLDMDVVRVHLSIHFYLFGFIVTAIIFNSLLLS